MKFHPYNLIAPSAWASYLINGDPGDLTDGEIGRCDAWIKALGFGLPVSCEDYGFCRRHDALREMPYAADCQEYTFLVE